MVLTLSERLILLVAAVLIFTYILRLHVEERKKEQTLLADIKAKLLPILIRNLNLIASTLRDEEKLLKEKVKLEGLFSKDLSMVIFVDFKQHFYETGSRLSDFRRKLARFDEASSKGEVGLNEARGVIGELKVEVKQLLEKLEELKEVEKLPPRKFSLK